MESSTRIYGAAIAIVSGGYALWRASTPSEITITGWVMLLLGAIVLAHGVVLLIDEGDRLGSASGPLMVGYAVVMLGLEGLREMGLMDGGMGNGPGMTSPNPGVDAGMVALAVLMLISGIVMLRTDSGSRGRM